MSRKMAAVEPIYPYSEWELIEESFSIDANHRNETMFSLGNGYIGFRGNFEEGYGGPAGTGLDGTYINGFYESEIIKYGEIAYGYAERSQTMLNVANGKMIRLFVGDEEFNMCKGSLEEYSRVLSLREGLLRRKAVWRSPSGKKIRIEIERLTSFKNKHLAVICYKVVPLNFTGKIKLFSAIDGNVSNLTVENDPRIGSGLQGRVLEVHDKFIDKEFGLLVQKTKNSGMSCACAMKHQVEGKEYRLNLTLDELLVGAEYEFNAEQDSEIRVIKYVSYVTNRDFEESSIAGQAARIVNDGYRDGYEKITGEQRDFMEKFWSRTDIEIEGDMALQQGIRVNMFHLLQSVGRDGKTNIAAKGLTGEGYEGHYFWDTETYILPFFLFNNPGISRKLLEYRYSTLEKARERARQMSHEKGALFPWRTINGEECSAYYPAGTAQYHINADIAFAIKRYMEVTEDREFLLNYGAEILFETARLWAGLGDFIPRKGNQFCINGVTGPDEYNAIVNNNCYTNLMAKENLRYAYQTAVWMKENYSTEYGSLASKISLEESELERWKEAADHMYIPHDGELGIYLQDDGFLDRAPWDFENTPKENYPLLLHYHPLVIYRHQVCKQADLVLVLFLLGQKFSNEEKKKNYDFYERVTTHDSSLSTAIFSIVASEVGYCDKAYQYFMSTARMDLDDSHGNTKDGIHAANMAGTWMCLVNGFAGMRVYDGVLGFNPYIPEKWDSYSFKITYRDRLIKVTASKNKTEYELLEGLAISVNHKGSMVRLERAGTKVVV